MKSMTLCLSLGSAMSPEPTQHPPGSRGKSPPLSVSSTEAESFWETHLASPPWWSLLAPQQRDILELGSGGCPFQPKLSLPAALPPNPS